MSERSIRTELPAQHYLQQLPKIQSLLLHLEAKTTEEAIELLKQGYEYVTTTPNGTMLFRKPK
jgi:hypothetical protein